jgi:hypothetical protein
LPNRSRSSANSSGELAKKVRRLEPPAQQATIHGSRPPEPAETFRARKREQLIGSRLGCLKTDISTPLLAGARSRMRLNPDFPSFEPRTFSLDELSVEKLSMAFFH